MYICRSKIEIEYVFKINAFDDIETAFDVIDTNGIIYIFPDDDKDFVPVYNSWSLCYEKECKDCSYKCFEDCDVIEVKQLMRTKKLERIIL